jgi:eukaryotic-like serine/threonine-protein kinase
MSVREKIRASFNVVVFLTVLVAVALLSAVTTIRFAIRGRETRVPNLIGAPVPVAERAARDLGLDIRVEDKLYSSLAAGSIVSQLPPAGTPIKIGQHVDVLVSLGPKNVNVPELVGSSLRAAEISAVEKGLTVGDVAQIHSTRGAAGEIIAQDPSAASAAVRGPAINLLISMGSTAPAYYCPSFVGRPLAEARLGIEKAGFKIGQIDPVTGEGGVPGTILSQSPPPGSRIDHDTVFDFRVAQ